MTKPEYPYSPEMFDAGYYGGGARGGFTRYRYNDPEQQRQLGYKWQNCQMGGDFHSILFIGCAMGFEVAYFRDHGKQAFGVDISEYAIEHALPQSRGWIQAYNGWSLQGVVANEGWDDSVDVVAAFDVLTLIPDEMMAKLASETVRVAQQKLVIRTIVKDFRNWNQEWDGQDGVTFKYRPFHEWDQMFSQSGEFHFHEGHIHHQYEGVYVWKRV